MSECENPSRRPWGLLVVAVVYTGAVLLIDTLATHGSQTPIDWGWFRWGGGSGFDGFKFVAWLVVPFVIVVRRMDWGCFGLGRWKRTDWLLLGGLAVAGGLAMAVVAMSDTLRSTYPSMAGAAFAEKLRFLTYNLLWLLSWLIGWEFLHRYFLLKPLSARWPKWGWLMVPISEGVYHLQKPALETLGMVAFSLVLTYWAMKRRNATLPFLAHLIIELELLAFMLLV